MAFGPERATTRSGTNLGREKRAVLVAALFSFLFVAALSQVDAADLRWTIETGVVGGGAIGDVEGPTHAHVRAVTDLGFLIRSGSSVPAGAVGTNGEGGMGLASIQQNPEHPPGIEWGLALHGALGGEDMRLGIKPRVRIPLGREWSVEPSAGLLFAVIEGDPRVSSTGFVAGFSLQSPSKVNLRADLEVVDVDRYTIRRENVPVSRGGGKESSLYGGVSFRERPGWAVTTAGVLVWLGVFLVVASAQ